jgi:hypothetical protein
MSKHTVKLTLVEMYAIKRSLSRQVAEKRKMIAAEFNKEHPDFDWLEKLSKDVDHEAELAEMFWNEIGIYRSTKRVVVGG